MTRLSLRLRDDRIPIRRDFYRRMVDRSGFAAETAAVMRAWPRGIEAAAREVAAPMLAAVAVSEARTRAENDSTRIAPSA